MPNGLRNDEDAVIHLLDAAPSPSTLVKCMIENVIVEYPDLSGRLFFDSLFFVFFVLSVGFVFVR